MTQKQKLHLGSESIFQILFYLDEEDEYMLKRKKE
jgi:hypothetical protein